MTSAPLENTAFTEEIVVNLGQTPVNMSKQIPVKLFNKGDIVINVETSIPTDLNTSVSQPEGFVFPGEFVMMQVGYTPRHKGRFETYITVTSSKQDVWLIRIWGTGY
ncbi:MAG: hypothetical protein SF053_19325 [Bacteroidia bacterium]|nr:hypothetical protein [Bacteroidia bacterium]